MSYEVIGDSKPLGQFASNKGYTDLIDAADAAADKYPALQGLFDTGRSKNVAKVITELNTLAATASKDVASTARTLVSLIAGKKKIVISDGVS